MRNQLGPTPQIDNLQNELRRELNPKGFLEEEVFQMVVEAAERRRAELPSKRHTHDQAFFRALREFRTIQARPNKPPFRSRDVIMFPAQFTSFRPESA